MQPAKRQRVAGDPFTIIEDPIRNRWLLLYLAIALECDTPILEPFWAQVSKELVLLMDPLKVILSFVSILPKGFIAKTIIPSEYEFLSPDVNLRWTCASTRHGIALCGDSFMQRAGQTDPEICFEFSTCLDPGFLQYSRVIVFEISSAGFNVYKFQATFRVHIQTFLSLEEMFTAIRSLNNKTIEALNLAMQ